MIRALIQKLGLDKIDDVLADEAHRVQVEVLREERDILAKMIARLDERIAALGGKRRGRPPKAAPAIATPPTPRPRRKKVAAREPGETLAFFVLRAFRNARGPMKVAHLVKRVRQLGYRTVSNPKNLLLRMYRVLRDKNIYRKVGTGLYALALPTPQRAVKPRRRKKVGPLLATSKARKTATEEAPAASSLEQKA